MNEASQRTLHDVLVALPDLRSVLPARLRPERDAREAFLAQRAASSKDEGRKALHLVRILWAQQSEEANQRSRESVFEQGTAVPGAIDAGVRVTLNVAYGVSVTFPGNVMHSRLHGPVEPDDPERARLYARAIERVDGPKLDGHREQIPAVAEAFALGEVLLELAHSPSKGRLHLHHPEGTRSTEPMPASPCRVTNVGDNTPLI